MFFLRRFFARRFFVQCRCFDRFFFCLFDTRQIRFRSRALFFFHPPFFLRCAARYFSFIIQQKDTDLYHMAVFFFDNLDFVYFLNKICQLQQLCTRNPPTRMYNIYIIFIIQIFYKFFFYRILWRLQILFFILKFLVARSCMGIGFGVFSGDFRSAFQQQKKRCERIYEIV